MSHHAMLKLPGKMLAPGALVAFLMLDWATYIPLFSPLGITPWNPPLGLLFGLLLLKGPAYLPLLPVGILLSDLVVRGLPLPIGSLVTEVGVVSACYLPGLLYLWFSRGRSFDVRLGSILDILQLAAVVTSSAAILAGSYVGVLVYAGYLPAEEFAASAIRYWVGETIGIMVVTPFMLLLFNPGYRFRLTGELAAQHVAILLAVLVVFGLWPGQQEQLYYVLFLPIAWIAVRSGLESVAIALVVMQVAIMIALHVGRQDAVNVTQVQAMMLVLACSGLAIGALVRERGRAETRIRLQQDAIARAARLGSIDRLTTSIAHEINQPLAAIGNYCRAMVRALEAPEANLTMARETSAKALMQVERAAAVIQRLRNLIIQGRAELAPVDVGRLISEAVELMRPDLARHGVLMQVEHGRSLPRVTADELQIQQLMTNIIRNGIEAMRSTPSGSREVRVVASRVGQDFVQISIADTGPGFPDGFQLVPDAPNRTVKADGLGIGLTLCHSIVEAHGGRFSISNASSPTTVSFTLKVAQGDENAESQ